MIDAILKIPDCDILIGIFWKRFGTPVKDAKCGTEHEFRLAYEAWKLKRRPQIMFYFNQKPYAPKSKEETDQLRQVLEFKLNYPREGLWWPYRRKTEFVDLVRNHLINFLRDQFVIEYNNADMKAADTLEKIGAEQAVAIPLDALKDVDSSVRVESVEALGRSGGERAVAALADALRDSDLDVRENAVDVLCQIGRGRGGVSTG